MKTPAILAVFLAASGCARSSVIPVSQDTIQILASAAPVCGAVGAQTVAVRQAAVETIRRGYDRFVILDAQYQNSVRAISSGGGQATTSGTIKPTGLGGFSAQATTVYEPDTPILVGAHNQGLAVKMFRDVDPAAANAVSARDTLGPQWQELVANRASTCF